MSGGVDSSVAALLLKKKGFEVIGVFMHFWAETHPGAPRHPSPEGNKCCSLASFNDARRVANKLDIPLYTVNFDRPFKKLVVDEFIAGYGAGETPNPCVNCNKYIKFELLLKKADELEADFVATGHYAKTRPVKCRSAATPQNAGLFNRVNGEDITYKLLRPKDLDKDQTYFLYTLDQKKLKRILFPLADLTKPAVRALAKKAGLTVAEKPESQEICFIPGKSHNDFLKRHLKLKPGPIKLLTPPNLPFEKGEEKTPPPDLLFEKGEGQSEPLPPLAKGRVGVGSDARILGRHQGLPLYTIGQRKGVEIGGIGPFYVARCDYKTNTLYVVGKSDDQALFSGQLLAKKINWIGGNEPKLPLRCEAVIRYRHKPIAAIIDKRPGKRIIVRFTKPQRAVTPGQSVVFYKGKEVLGGGVIDS